MTFASHVYTTDDLAAILKALAATAILSSGHSPQDREFQRGYLAAIATMATALHCDLPADVARRVLESR